MSITDELLSSEITLIIVSGRLDHNQVDELQTILTSTIDKGCLELIVDLTEVSYVNSSGLRCLVTGWRQSSNLGGHLVLCGLNSQIGHVFSTVGFDKVFDIFISREEAMQHLAAN